MSYTLPRKGASAIIGPAVRSKGTAQRPPAGRLPVQREESLPEQDGSVVGRLREAIAAQARPRPPGAPVLIGLIGRGIQRSEERRGGKGGVRTCRSRW